MKLLALDFDGVISDSAPEAYLVALRTYAELRDDDAVRGLRDRTERLDADGIRADPTYLKFAWMIPLGNRAEDYAVELTLIAKDQEARDQAEFDEAFAAEPDGFLDAFHDCFYQTRTALRAENPERWLGLMGPYSELLPLLRRRAGDVVLSIATAKDRTSVSLLLERYGVADLFPPERVFDKDAGRSKRAHLQALHEETGIPYREILFVDDKVNHLGDVAPLGVEGALASWGYNGEREQRIAREHGHRVLTLETLDVELFGDSPVSPC